MRRIILISVSAVTIVSVTACLVFLCTSQPYQNNLPFTEKQTQPYSLIHTEPSTPNQTFENEIETIPETSVSATNETTEETDIETIVPEDLELIISRSGRVLNQIHDIGCRQLVTVNSDGSSAQIDLYQLTNNTWVREEDLSCSGFVGANGVTEDMHEGSNATPKGFFPISEAFYISEQPETDLSLFQITNDTYWIDDPDSAFYNRRVEGTENKDWNSAEHMIDYTVAYEYGFVVDYNTEAVYNAGSAIFFHVSYNPTAGCVGTSRDMVLKYIAALDLSEKPYIVIV